MPEKQVVFFEMQMRFMKPFSHFSYEFKVENVLYVNVKDPFPFLCNILKDLK